MPAGTPVKPEKPKELRTKILATKPLEEETILRDVQSHLNKYGPSSYHQTTTARREVSLTSTNCVIFLVRGKFEYGWTTALDEDGREQRVGVQEIDAVGLGHPMQDESRIELHEYTVIVIIDAE